VSTTIKSITLPLRLAFVAFQLLFNAATILSASSAGSLDSTGRPSQFRIVVQTHHANQPQLLQAHWERPPPQRSTAPDCVLGPESETLSVIKDPTWTNEKPAIELVQNSDGVFEVPTNSGSEAVLHQDQVIMNNYQRYYNIAWDQATQSFNAGEITVPEGQSWQTILGQRTDLAARAILRNFLSGHDIPEGPGTDVLVNRWLRESFRIWIISHP
jgi:hypothetical protein